MSIGEIICGFMVVNSLLWIGLFYLYLKNRKDEDLLHASLFFLCGTIFLFGQLQLEHGQSAQGAVFWNKFQYIGIVGFLYTLPLFTSTITKRRLYPQVRIGLGIITMFFIVLLIFSNFIISNVPRFHYTSYRAEKGILYPLFATIIVVIGAYFYLQIIASSRKHMIVPIRSVNYTPVIVGIGIAFVLGIIEIIGVFLDKPLLQGISQPFILLAIFIMSISFAWTFLSQYSLFSVALDESQLEIEKLVKKAKLDYVEFVNLIARTLDAKDHYTAGHALRVMDYSVKIANALNISKSEIELLKQASLLHDIGKISIPDGVLNKKTRLTKKDREHIYKHPVVAKHILSTVSDFRDILDIIYSHHERVDGKGYPDGKMKDDIPLLSRILAVADAYDAMRSERPYRKAKSKEEAIDELREVRGSQLDEEIVDKFIEVIVT